MRALPAGSFEYFGGIADGKVAVPPEPIPVVVAVSPPLGTAAFASVAGVPVGAADAVVPHSAFRNSLHVFSFNVPADCAALYLTLHSLIVMAFAAEDAATSSSATASIVAHDISERVGIELSLHIDANPPNRRCEFSSGGDGCALEIPTSACRSDAIKSKAG